MYIRLPLSYAVCTHTIVYGCSGNVDSVGWYHHCTSNILYYSTVHMEHLADIKFGESPQLVGYTTDYKYAGSEVGGDFNLTILVNMAKPPN